MDGGRQLTWRSAVVPVPAKGRVRITPTEVAGFDPADVDPAGFDPADVDPADLDQVDVDPVGSERGNLDHEDPASSRDRAVTEMAAWCRSAGPPVWLVEGAAGTGKTKLLSDVADRVSETVRCGWARPGLAAYAVIAAARNGRSALLLVDDADTRGDLLSLMDVVTAAPGQTRIIVSARDFGPWWTDLLARLDPRHRDQLAAGRVVLSQHGPATTPGRALAPRQGRVVAADPRAAALSTLAGADPGSASVLLRQAAVVVALSTRVGQLDPAAVRSALRDLFEEDEGYWRRASAEVAIAGQPAPALRSAISCAAVVGDDGLAEAATALRRVPALAVGAADRLARMAVWWHGLYARLGASAVPIPRLPSWLADRLPDGIDNNGISWTVAALEAERRATATLSRMAVDAHRDVWPVAASRSADIAIAQAAEAHDSLRRAVAVAGPVDEALAWLTGELDLDDTQLAALAEAIDYPSRDLGRTGIVLTRRLLAAATDGVGDGLGGVGDGDPVADERRAGLTVGLGARYSEVGRWDEARQHTETAVHIFHRLVVLDRDRYLPDLAAALANLASCLAQLGERDEALTRSYEAVTLYRELVAAAAAGPAHSAPASSAPVVSTADLGSSTPDGPAVDDDEGDDDKGDREADGGGDADVVGDVEFAVRGGWAPHLPELARALTNLAACLSRSGRRTAALGAAGQAVALYRELERVEPARYAVELASAEHNWRVCRGVLGEPAAGARPD